MTLCPHLPSSPTFFIMSTLASSIFPCNSQVVFRSRYVAEGTSELCPRIGYYSGSRSFSLYHCIRLKHGYVVGFKCVAYAERNDSFYMKRCVEIAKKALGFTSPNPMVGCVIVKDGEIVGEGFHPKAGEPHAEVYALRNAGDLAENATAYVSLEPCNHYGRTPPCTEALLRAKVKKVVVGMVDPNPIVASKGVERLRESGVEVKVGVEEELCRKLNEAYIHKMLTGRPFVALRYSLLISGQMSNQLGKGAEESGGYFSKLMQEYDGVVASSSGTYFAKYNLALKSKEIGAKPPLQIVVASSSNAPLCLPVMTTKSEAIVFKDRDAIIDQATEKNLHEMDIDIVVLDRMDLGLILDHCGKRGLSNVLVDFRGGCNDFVKVIREGLEEGLCQKLIIELLPVFEGKEVSSIVGLDDLAETRLSLRDLQTKVFNRSIVVDGYIF